MNRLPVALIALALPWVGSVPAQADPVVRLGVDDAVRRALDASHELRALEAIAESADRGGDVAAAARRPTVDALAGFTRRSSVPEFAVADGAGGSRTIFPDIQDNWTARVEASMPLYTGGRTSGAIDAAGFERDAAARDVDTGRADLVHEVRESYWSLALALESERVLRAALASFDAHLVDAGNRERFGMAARNEVLAVRVERERAELARLRAENLAGTLEADLVRLLDLPAGTTIEPIEPLAVGDAPEDDLDTRVAAALAARPERAALAARIAAGEASERIERSNSRPRVGLVAGWDYGRPNRAIVPPEDRWDDSWDVSVRLTHRLFDGGRTRAQVARTAARTDALRQTREALDRRIRRDVVARSLDLDGAVRAVDVAEASVAAARESLRIARDRYREGVIPSSELLDAETAVLDAELDRAHAAVGVRRARASLDRAVGR